MNNNQFINNAKNNLFNTNSNIKSNQNKSKNANNELSDNLASIIDRKFIMNFLNKPGSDVWKLKGLEKLEFVIKMLEELMNYLENIEIVDTEMKLSRRQQFVIEDFNIDLEESINNELDGKVQYQRFIIDSYWKIWDFFEDYGNKVDTPFIYRNEYDVITKIVKNFYNIALKVLNEHKK